MYQSFIVPTPQPDVYWLHGDHLGTGTYVTNSSGQATQFFLNLPFGETMAEQNLPGAYDNPYKFNAKELDAETGLYYYGARYYDARVSVWLGVDPLAEAEPGWSPYRAFYDNPIKYIDPDGQLEYESAEAFAKANKGKTWDKDRGKGDWLTSDRENNTSICLLYTSPSPRD